MGLDLIYCPIVLNQLFVAIGRFNASRDYYSDSSGYFREHRLQEDVSFSNLWRRSSQVVRASGCQCTSRNSAEFDPSILKHNGMLESEIKKKIQKNPPFKFLKLQRTETCLIVLTLRYTWKVQSTKQEVCRAIFSHQKARYTIRFGKYLSGRYSYIRTHHKRSHHKKSPSQKVPSLKNPC